MNNILKGVISYVDFEGLANIFETFCLVNLKSQEHTCLRKIHVIVRWPNIQIPGYPKFQHLV